MKNNFHFFPLIKEKIAKERKVIPDPIDEHLHRGIRRFLKEFLIENWKFIKEFWNRMPVITGEVLLRASQLSFYYIGWLNERDLDDTLVLILKLS